MSEQKPSATAAWIEAMRLRTLPVSVSGVIAALAYAIMGGTFKAAPAILCLIFAVLAQIASNFANEYYDFRAGLDAPGREGPRRGVTEGDITPHAMLVATFGTLGLACLVGLSLIYWGGWWLIAAGITIAVGVLIYSTGPYPLSHHALGELAVIAFFGIIPVNLTFYLQSGVWDMTVFFGSLSIGLMGANVLIINNYRDLEDDRSVGKTTLAVLVGRPVTSFLYLINGWVAIALVTPVWSVIGGLGWCVPVIYATVHTLLWFCMGSRRGARLTPLLGGTAMLMLFYAIGFIIAVC